ncbi:MAG: hypothetical protein IT498_08750 [Rubrivivax sp.]|uniref:hypothetical protein n=1 Tax=Ottowia sp. TaxID=1898956 RepID=UPI0011DB55A2|nr:hypothetical protein [Ottowia sp.]MCC6814116.1 hypothetical protein [Rubrivivax sp.]MCZ2088442.1 hypothetical protein [Burkholderiales bacterium]TXI16685.1 MAG: hypothetical protein E6Q65_08655 [Ottowia sp.]HNI84828.1 hypothetical protein [Ottowia sp.]HNJ44769.1 hypothetical protein [Ottowia sp.]
MRSMHCGSLRSATRRAAIGLALVTLVAAGAQAQQASGELALQARSGVVKVAPRYAYLLAGPSFDGKPMRRLVLSEVDLTSAIQKCDRLGCVSSDLHSGVTVDFDGGPRLGYWFVGKGQMVQHSDTAQPATMQLKQDSHQRLAGSWTLKGDVGATGSVTFDAPLAKTFARN